MENKTVIIERLRKRATQADDMIALLRKQIGEIRKIALAKAYADEMKGLVCANEKLEVEVEQLKKCLIQAEIRNGVKQIPLNDSMSVKVSNDEAQTVPQATTSTVVASSPAAMGEDKKSKKVAKIKPNKKEGEEKKQEDAEPDVSRLDLRIGLIVSAKKHPDADSLYVEDVDLGEGKNRTVVSGLVKFVPVEQMQNRLAVLLCNLKPAKMRGVTSEAMVMCASTPENVEILVPPPGSIPGERVGCDGFPGEPEKELNPKKKIFEKVAPDLKTDSNCIATYKGVPLTVPGKGNIVAPTLKNVQIK